MGSLRILVLGSAAGGGYPQWNCRGPVGRRFWEGQSNVQARTQSSIAVSFDGDAWLLINCSPDIRQQILNTPALHPKTGLRSTPIGAILLTNGDIDHIAGLLTLREKQAYKLYATPTVLDVLTQNRIFDAVDRDFVPRLPVALGESFEALSGLRLETFAVPGKVPLYMEDGTPEIGAETETTIGVEITSADGKRALYIPGCAHISDTVRERIKNADLLMFDGTLWTDTEMVDAGLGKKTGHRMGHISMSGDDGSMAQLDGLSINRRVFVHINNTNPVLIDDSVERQEAEARGWEISFDGMEISL